MLRQAVILLSALALAQSWSGFKGIPGQYCKVRPGQQCCENREDDCTVSILGNHKCYCDMFCHREHEEMHGDCCPDFEETCMGKQVTGPRYPEWTQSRDSYQKSYYPPREERYNYRQDYNRNNYRPRAKRSIEDTTQRPPMEKPWKRAPGVDPDCRARPCTCPEQNDPTAWLWCCCTDEQEQQRPQQVTEQTYPPRVTEQVTYPPQTYPPQETEEPHHIVEVHQQTCTPCPVVCQPRKLRRCGAVCQPRREYSHQPVPFRGERRRRHVNWGNMNRCCTVNGPGVNCRQVETQTCDRTCEGPPQPTPPTPPTRPPIIRTFAPYTVTFAPMTRTFAPIIVTRPPEVYTRPPMVMTREPEIITFPPPPQPPQPPVPQRRLCPVSNPCCMKSQCCCESADECANNDWQIQKITQRRFFPNRPPLGFQLCGSTQKKCDEECPPPPPPPTRPTPPRRPEVVATPQVITESCCPNGPHPCCNPAYIPQNGESCPSNPCCARACESTRIEHSSVDWDVMNNRRVRDIRDTLPVWEEYRRSCTDDQGRIRTVGEQVLINCKQCTCTSNGWEGCSPSADCLIQDDLLKANNGGRYT